MDFNKGISRMMGHPTSHASKLAEHLNKLREDQPELCDVSICSEGKEIRAHWSVLITCPYFESMYNSGLTEKSSGKVSILVGKREAVEKVIEFLYIGKCEMSMENLGDILEVADYLQCLKLKQLCNEYLSNYPLDIKTCVKICLISSLYDLQINDIAMRYLKGHLPQIMQGEDILTLTEDSILLLLTDDTLRYVSQGSFLQFLIRWLKHDFDARKDRSKMLFEKIDYEKVPHSNLEEVLKDQQLSELIPIENINKITSRRKNEDDNLQTREVILVGGGMSQYKTSNGHNYRRANSNVFAFNLSEEKWTKLWDMPMMGCERPIIKVCEEDGRIYVVDKESLESDFSCYKRYNLYNFDRRSKVWTLTKIDHDINLMGFALHDLILCGSRVFLLGSGFKTVNQIGTYCKLMEVKEDGSLDTNYLFSCCSIDVFYGCDLGRNRIGIICEWGIKKTFSIKYYDISENVDKRLTEPNRAKSCSSTLALTKMMVNKDEIVQLDLKKKTIRKFSPNDNTWFCFPKITKPPVELCKSAMYYFVNDQLFVFGGENSKKCFKYLCHQRKWMELESLPLSNLSNAMYNSAVCMTTLPAELVLCHPDCPHCVYNPKASGVTYPESEHSDDSYNESDYYDDDYDWDNDYDDDERSSRSECSVM